MYYYSIDYKKAAPTPVSGKSRFSFLKKSKLYKQYKQNRQYRQFAPTCARVSCEENEYFLITLPSGLKDLKKYPREIIQQAIRNAIKSPEDTYFFYEAPPEIAAYLPPEIPFCEPESREEVYIKYCKKYIAHILESISPKNARHPAFPSNIWRLPSSI